MMHYDLVVIGGGPAGQKAAVQAAKTGCKVMIIEDSADLGGACVYHGTIPSKTLRESALRISSLRSNAHLLENEMMPAREMSVLTDRLNYVLNGHRDFIRHQMERNRIISVHGRASFNNPHEIDIIRVNGVRMTVQSRYFVIATGSRPRQPDNIPVDHEHIFDSDSVLTMLYLPSSLTVLGGGVIASEYASIFQSLGVKVTMIDRNPYPLGFLDQDLYQEFAESFTRMGGTWLGGRTVSEVRWDRHQNVVTRLDDGTEVRTEKMLCAAGRIANTEFLQPEKAGIRISDRGHLLVDDELRTSVPHIYAAGDVIGPPALASASMEQGRRAACKALGLDIRKHSQRIPSGIYSIPELSCIGLSEQQARDAGHKDLLVGRARFRELARGLISGNEEGSLKIICTSDGREILGIHIIGESATELIHIGQMAMQSEDGIDVFVENIFNFPTMAEAYRVAALDILGQIARRDDAY